MNKFRLIQFSLLLLLVFTKCEDEQEDQPVPETEDGSWVIYSPLKWTHDGSSFGDAFKNNFGLSLEVFEEEYYDRIKAYLTALN